MKTLQNFTEEHSENKEKRKRRREEEKKIKILKTVHFLNERFKIFVKTKFPPI